MNTSDWISLSSAVVALILSFPRSCVGMHSAAETECRPVWVPTQSMGTRVMMQALFTRRTQVSRSHAPAWECIRISRG